MVSTPGISTVMGAVPYSWPAIRKEIASGWPTGFAGVAGTIKAIDFRRLTLQAAQRTNRPGEDIKKNTGGRLGTTPAKAEAEAMDMQQRMMMCLTCDGIEAKRL